MHRVAADPEWSGQSEELLSAARAGSPEALGRLLDGCRAYLLLLANQHLAADLQAKGGASDLVQQTFLEAQQDFETFQGRTARELMSWLRGILRHNVADFRRRWRDRAVRQVAQERSLTAPDSAGLGDQLIADTPLPIEKAAAAEEAEAVQRAIVRLSPDHRRVIELHHREGRSFHEIAGLLGRSHDAVRKLWFRAVERLREEMKVAP